MRCQGLSSPLSGTTIRRQKRSWGQRQSCRFTYIAVGALLANREVLILFAGEYVLFWSSFPLVQIISIRGFGRKIF